MKHADGSECLHGTAQVKKNFKPCCKRFANATNACVYDIRIEWYSKKRHWGIRVADGGSSYLVIKYCPYCGHKL
jgi:hypothetical protein